ncbi:hypothetical protein TNCV_2881811 [Trichonephila clavipes]|nr:hypothetical protein TNCV_2881811 [Trichonephila clavipes]
MSRRPVIGHPSHHKPGCYYLTLTASQISECDNYSRCKWTLYIGFGTSFLRSGEFRRESTVIRICLCVDCDKRNALPVRIPANVTILDGRFWIIIKLVCDECVFHYKPTAPHGWIPPKKSRRKPTSDLNKALTGGTLRTSPKKKSSQANFRSSQRAHGWSSQNITEKEIVARSGTFGEIFGHMAREASLHPISDNLMGNDSGHFMLVSSSRLIGRASRWRNCLGLKDPL